MLHLESIRHAQHHTGIEKSTVVYSYVDSSRTQRHNDNDETVFLEKIYLSLYLKGLCVRGNWRPNRTATYCPPLLWPSVLLSRFPGLLDRRPGGSSCWVLAFSTASCHQRVWSPKLTDLLSLPSYIIVQSPTQYLWNGMFDQHQAEITVTQFIGHSLPVHQSMTVPWDFYLVPYCQPSLPTPMEYAFPPSLEWHVWPGRRSIYNRTRTAKLCFSKILQNFWLSLAFVHTHWMTMWSSSNLLRVVLKKTGVNCIL